MTLGGYCSNFPLRVIVGMSSLSHLSGFMSPASKHDNWERPGIPPPPLNYFLAWQLIWQGPVLGGKDPDIFGKGPVLRYTRLDQFLHCWQFKVWAHETRSELFCLILNVQGFAFRGSCSGLLAFGGSRFSNMMFDLVRPYIIYYILIILTYTINTLGCGAW